MRNHRTMLCLTGVFLAFVYSLFFLNILSAGETIIWYGDGHPDNVGNPGGGGTEVWPLTGSSGNSITIYGDVQGYVYGGSGAESSEHGNTVVIDGAAVGGDTFGGYGYNAGSGSSGASGNTLIADNGAFIKGVDYFVAGLAYTADSGSALSSNNATIIGGGGEVASNGVYGGDAAVAAGVAEAFGNSLTIDGGKTYSHLGDRNSTLVGGSASVDGAAADGAAVSRNNTVNINDSDIQSNVMGGRAVTFGTASATASGNAVVIGGAATVINGTVRGGDVSGFNGRAAAVGNSVLITGGTMNDSIYGGFAATFNDEAFATGNSVTISGVSTFFQGNDIFGGYADGTGGDGFTGNTLNAWEYAKADQLGNVTNFQYFNFILSASTADGDTILDASGTVYFDDSGSPGGGAGRSSSVTGLSVAGGGAPLEAGHSVTLIQADGGFAGTLANNNTVISGRQGFSLISDWLLEQTADSLTATRIGGAYVNPQMKALSEGRTAAAALLNRGADLVASAGMDAARFSGSGAAGGPSAFAAAQGGAFRQKTGSHVDVDGFNLVAGLAWNAARRGNAAAALGAFVETGRGNYDSFNDFSAAASVRGGGGTSYFGGGLLGRIDFAAANSGTFYAEASLRAGRSEADFSSADLRDPVTGQIASYDSGVAYYGAHLGLGHVWNIGGGSRLDFHAKGFLSRLDGDSMKILGDSFAFGRVDSTRVLAGLRYSFASAAPAATFPFTIEPYAGASYEYEFDGGAAATARGFTIDAPSLRGGTATAELGVSLKRAEKLSVDIVVRGSLGARRGVDGGLRLGWAF